MSDLVFMDTETLGLQPEAPVWEFAAIRRSVDGTEQEFHCFIDHYPLPWIDSLPDEFADDYRNRYNPEKAKTQWDALEMVRYATRGATVVGAVPNFDTERLQRMLVRMRLDCGGSYMPWHYHLVDVENLAVGFLAGRGKILPPPWKSDELSKAIGVDPEQFARHTAMGDVLWVQAQYDAIMSAP
jgi:hypothetical protein